MDLNCKPSLSPHTLQNPESYYCETLNRKLNENSPQLEYYRRRGHDKTAVHFGQRGLLVSEIEFLTIALTEIFEDSKTLAEDNPINGLINSFNNLKVNDKNLKILVVYIGAAEGKHLRLLCEMFPFLSYLFIDPERIYDDYGSFPNVKIDKCIMTNEKALKIKEIYKEWSILYISDIRNVKFEKGKLSDSKSNEIISDDMKKQQEWYYILEPEMSYLKFRLPYPEKTNRLQKQDFEYLDGDIFFLPWSTNTSTETRILVKRKSKVKAYNITKYEQQMFRYNLYERVLCYKHEIEVAGIDHCYDCSAEILVMNEYLTFQKKFPDLEFPNELKSIKQIIEKINDFLQSPKERLVRMYYEHHQYDVFFNDMQYGKSASQIFTDESKRLALRRGSEHSVPKYYSRS